jgi:hypothetical protein
MLVATSYRICRGLLQAGKLRNISEIWFTNRAPNLPVCCVYGRRLLVSSVYIRRIEREGARYSVWFHLQSQLTNPQSHVIMQTQCTCAKAEVLLLPLEHRGSHSQSCLRKLLSAR